MEKDKATATRNVNYRGPVEMSGWVLKYQSHVRSRTVKRYFKLTNSVLSNHPELTGPATWEVSLSKCVVRSEEDKCDVIVRLPDREIRFQTSTVELARRWCDAIRSGSQCNVEDFYKLGKELGAGAFGAVRLAYDLTTGEKRAVKMVKRSSNAKELEFVQREVNVLLSISHKNIVRTYDIFEERTHIYFVLEYVSGGDFFDYIVKRKYLKELPTKIIMHQILEGLAYLHANNIVHRDIKPENVLIASEDPIVVQLTDFGFANFIDPCSTEPGSDMKSVVGTGCYMPPEVIDSRGHGKPVDLYATGVVLYRVLTGKLPFRGVTLQECYEQVMSGKIDFHCREWRDISNEGKEFCATLLAADPAARPTAQQSLSHPWFVADEEFKLEQARQQHQFESKSGTRMHGVRNITR
jgi:serine/threonine protein kinase